MTRAPDPQHEIDYLAKDFDSFRRLMLDHISLHLPGWDEHRPVEMTQAVVDVLAYVADYLSYYQDAVATEAYLGTARRRISVRRHARLLDYTLDDGCNARVWVQIPVPDGYENGILVPHGTQFLTRVGVEVETECYAPDDPVVSDYKNRGAQFFETMRDATLYSGLNRISFVTQPRSLELNAHASDAVLADSLDPVTGRLRLENLKVGDVLIFQTVTDPQTGRGLDDGADPVNRHAVRLTSVIPASEGDGPVVRIAWAAADAPPRPLPLRRLLPAGGYEDVSVARGNIVLADHGRTIRDEVLPPVPPTGRYNPPLLVRNLTFHAPYPDSARTRPASAALEQDRRAIVPAIEVVELCSEIARSLRLKVTPNQDGAPRLERVVAGAGDQAGDARPAYRIQYVRYVEGKNQPAFELGPIDKQEPPEAPAPQPDDLPKLPEWKDASERRLELTPIPGSRDAAKVVASAAGGVAIEKPWRARRELTTARPRARDFVVESEDDGRAFLRFGFGDVGWQPSAAGASFRATYRVGMGVAGNVGPNAIRHVVTGDATLRRIIGGYAAHNARKGAAEPLRVRNFLPAQGGRDPARIDTARIEAPATMKDQRRCITTTDYQERADECADVAQSVASIHAVGSWSTVRIYVRRRGGRPVDDAFRGGVARVLERYRMIGHHVEVLEPCLVPLRVDAAVHLQEGCHAVNAVHLLLEALAWQSLSGDTRAFFDPSGFAFGQTFRLSAFVNRAMRVPGVRSVEVNAFSRAAAPGPVEEICLQEVELAQVDHVVVAWAGLPRRVEATDLSGARPVAAPQVLTGWDDPPGHTLWEEDYDRNSEAEPDAAEVADIEEPLEQDLAFEPDMNRGRVGDSPAARADRGRLTLRIVGLL